MEDFEMAISEKKIYLRTGDTQTVYLKSVITDASIKIGDYTMYNDFVHDPRDFERNNVLYHYPINGNQLKKNREILLNCLWCKVSIYPTTSHLSGSCRERKSGIGCYLFFINSLLGYQNAAKGIFWKKQ